MDPELAAWIGRVTTVESEIGLGAARCVAGMLDRDPAGLRRGDPLPPHWTGLFFADPVAQARLGPDGHAAPGVVLPPIPLPRRMGAGRRARFHGAFRIGDHGTRSAEVVAITPKQARTGAITLLTMRHSYHRDGALLAVEEFDAIYREAVPPGAVSPVTPPRPAPRDPAWQVAQTLDATLVFRFSAITWNAHRIHYDADYARVQEGYPAAVQNGGLTMQLLLEAAVPHLPGALVGYAARLTRPLSVGDAVVLAGAAAAAGRAEAWVADRDGHLCAELSMEYAT